MKRFSLLLAGLVLLLLPIGLLPVLLSGPLLRLGVWIDTGLVSMQRSAGDARARYELTLIDNARVGLAAIDAWYAAGRNSLLEPLPINLPYAERWSLSGEQSWGGSGSVSVFDITFDTPGVLRVVTTAESAAAGGMIVDVLRRSDNQRAYESLGAYGPAPLDVWVNIEQSGSYLLRVQPVLGSTGGFGLRIEQHAALGFPVATDASDPVKSRFGAARDGGRRQHKGIDIFAPRGTPVIAAADGIIVRTGNHGLGGLHIWQQGFDTAGNRLGALYYAHLERLDVQVGDRVARGTPIGTVGNTGNARTTPPHLHFGVYRRFAGPVDPLPLTGERRRQQGTVTAGHALPRWLSVNALRVNLRSGPGTGFAVVGELERGALVRADALVAGGDWVRVHTGDGQYGFMARVLLGNPTVQLAANLRMGSSENGNLALLAAPRADAPVLTHLDANHELQYLGQYGQAIRVRTAGGLIGWVISLASL